MGDTLNLATLARDSASPSGDTSGQEVVATSHQDSDSNIEFSTVRVCITDQSARLQPSAKGVCSCVQIASLSQTESSDPEIPTESEVKDLLLKLITQTKEQQNEINALRLTLKNGLEQLEIVLREFKGDIAEQQPQIARRTQKSISDIQPLVKPFTPSGKLSFGDTPVALRTRSKRQPTNLRESESNLRSADKQDVIKGTEASSVTTDKPSNCKAYTAKILRQDTPSDNNADGSYLSSTIESDEDIPSEASRNLDSAESNSKLSRKKSRRHHPEKTTS